MKNFLKIVSIAMISFLFIACESGSGSDTKGFSKQVKSGGLDVSFYSDKPLVVGDNIINVKVMQNGKVVNGVTKVEFKAFMPEMPGMPYMKSSKLMKPDGDSYSENINLSMGGTWQIRIFIEKDGKKYKFSSSVII